MTRVPPFTMIGLVGIGGGAIVICFGIDVPRVGDLALIVGGLPQFRIPMVSLTFESLQNILLCALLPAAIGLIEQIPLAVLVGVIVSALAYAPSNATRTRARTEPTEDGAKVYQIERPLFFGQRRSSPRFSTPSTTLTP